MHVKTVSPRDAQRLAVLNARIESDQLVIELARSRMAASARERSELLARLDLPTDGSCAIATDPLDPHPEGVVFRRATGEPLRDATPVEAPAPGDTSASRE